MSETNEQNENPGDEGGTNPPGGGKEGGGGQGGDILNQQIKHRQLSARVPDSVSRGVFSTGAIVLTGATEFVVDFLVRMARPYAVAARVVLPHAAMQHLVNALADNISKYEQRFGAIDAMPKGEPNAQRPSIQEIYDDLRLPDENLSGVYANACIIGHSPAEFVLDFVTNFFPRSAVSARIYLSARQAPQLLKGLRHAAQQLQQRRNPQQFPPGYMIDPPKRDDDDEDDKRKGGDELLY